MADERKFQAFLGGILSNAAWSLIQRVAGGAVVTSLITAIWEKIRHGSVDWYGIGGLFLLTCAVFVFPYFKKRKIVPVGDTNLNEKNDSGSLASSTTNLLTAVQIECIQLARDLRQLLDEIGPQPSKTNFDMSRYSGNNQVEGLAVFDALTRAWSEKLGHTYVVQGYANRIRSVVHRLGASGLCIAPLEQYSTWIGSESSLEEAVKALYNFAIELEYPH
jgi:hypothetical protein